MTTAQKVIKYCAIALAVFIIVAIAVSVLSAFSIISGLFGGNTSSEDFKELTISDAETIKRLEIDIEAAKLTILTGETFKFETNNKYITCRTDEGELQIEERDHRLFAINDTNSEILLYIPDGFVFDEADISTGAGSIDIKSLSANTLSFDIGAGKVTVDELNIISSAEIEGGAGDFEIRSGTINNLDFDMGVGDTELALSLCGRCELNMGVGKLDLELLGGKENYRIDVNKGLGAININGTSMNDGDTFGSGSNLIKIDGGVGSIDVDFK